MENDLYAVVVVSTVIFVLFAVFIVIFLLLFQQRQLQNVREKAALEAAFEQEILQSQVEVQNQTLQQVGHELHDNIGQLLSLTKLHLNTLADETLPHSAATRITDVSAVVDLTIREVRALTKSLDVDFIRQFGLVSSLRHELDRLQQTGRFDTDLLIGGEVYSLGFQREIVLFRIMQEALNNSIKHAHASRITLSMTYQPDELTLTITDDGQGFDLRDLENRALEESGAGLRTMQRRAELIGGTCHLRSEAGRGTCITLTAPVVPA